MNSSDKISIFLVDDDSMFLKSLEHLLLHKLKYQITIKPFNSGEEFLLHLNEKPDIVVLDYLLNDQKPGAMNGIDVLTQVMNQHPGTTVIMLSGFEKLEVAVESIKHGAYDYVIKNENALLKIQNLIRNAVTSIILRRQVKGYNFWVKVIIAVIFIMLLTAIAIELFFKGILH
jgi:two-component system OmpR family response regulator